jgi:hypothetical protein
MSTATDYDPTVTRLCERALVTVIGNVGPWAQQLYLVGGLAPRYLVEALPEDATPHVGSRDVDLAIVIAVTDPSDAAYHTLEQNLKRAGFKQAPLEDDPDFRWRREIEGMSVTLEFLCETDQVAEGRMFKPKAGAGSRFQAFNVRGLHLVAEDFFVRSIEAERLDDGGLATAEVRVTGLLPFIVLKAFAFKDRHEPKDAYDPIWVLLHHHNGPEEAGRHMAESPVASNVLVEEARQLLRERYASPAHEGPAAYASFHGSVGGAEELARSRQEAFEVVRLVLDAFERARTDDT